MPQLPTPLEIDTPRLRLRQWRAADRAPFAALNADPRVMAHFPSTLDRTASDAIAERSEALIAERGWGFWAVERRDSGDFIGFVGLNVPTAALPFSPCVEIGWRLVHAAWGQGLASEAARAALTAGFETLGLAEIVSFTALSNRRSQAVMERLGMRRTAEDFDHPVLPEGHPLRRHCLYRLNADGWRADVLRT
ncbi:MAG: GNAT family N-acetyltransferase [Proteobacteria bacterium]|nr:GNAT family N-acetyltransferase [Pseudomonadota bacterium]